MAEYYGGEYIYSVLTGDSAVVALVGSSVYNAAMIPQTDTSEKVINFYPVGTLDNSLNYFQLEISVDCRAKTDYEAYEIATAVSSALNRKAVQVGSSVYFGTISILPVIRPADEADSYNVPVQILVRRK